MTHAIYPCLWLEETGCSLPQPFEFNEAAALILACEHQAKITHDWNRITLKNIKNQYRWWKGRFGVSWQIHPAHLCEVFQQSSPTHAIVFKMPI